MDDDRAAFYTKPAEGGNHRRLKRLKISEVVDGEAAFFRFFSGIVTRYAGTREVWNGIRKF